MAKRVVVYGFWGGLFRAIGGIFQHWPLIAVIAFFISPMGPHLRWEYSYRDTYGHRSYGYCTYLGSRGFITPSYVEGCPVIAWLDARPKAEQ